MVTRSSYIRSFDEITAEPVSLVGGKAKNLAILSRASSFVPNGYCITVEAHEHLLAAGTLPEGLIEEIIAIKTELGGKIALRSSANCEDGERLSMAGVFQSHYVHEDENVKDVLEKIYTHARSDEVGKFLALHGMKVDDVKMAIVAQQLVNPTIAGVVYTSVNEGLHLVQYVDGFGEKLVDGQINGASVLIDDKGVIVQSSGFDNLPFPAHLLKELALHIQSIMSLFPDVAQDIEFACTDDTVFIVQARPLTSQLGTINLAPTVEDCLSETKHRLRQLVTQEKAEMPIQTAVFSDANYSELLPRPTEMDIGVYTYSFTGIDGIEGATQQARREMGYLNENESIGIIKPIGGRTYFSIARNAALYHIGFPETKKEYFETLVNEYLQTVNQTPEKGSYPQMGLYLQDPTLQDLTVRYGARAQEYMEVYKKFVATMRVLADEFIIEFREKDLPEMMSFVTSMKQVELATMTEEQVLGYCNAVLEHLRTKSCLYFVKAARLGFYYSQRLKELLEDKLSLDAQAAESLYSRLNQGLEGSEITEVNIAIAGAATEVDALAIAQELIGHFSTGEMLEIRHRPLRDVPEALNMYVQGLRHGSYRQQFKKQKAARRAAESSLMKKLSPEDKEEMAHVLRSSQTYMALRETIKYRFAMENLLLRDGLEGLGGKLGLEEGDIYFLYPRELSRFVADPLSMKHLIMARRLRFELYPELSMPSVIREGDIDTITIGDDDKGEFHEAVGKFLADGATVEGLILNIDDFIDMKEATGALDTYLQADENIVLVGRQMNLSHDPLIAQSAGLIIQNAGLVAHGAQRAREQGKGAVGGISTKKLTTGMRVLFDPSKKYVKRIDT